MNRELKVFKALSDRQRLRAVLLLRKKELCVCQLMAVLGISQPLVSRNLTILKSAGLLDSRREGKLMFYCLKRDCGLFARNLLLGLAGSLKDDPEAARDAQVLVECKEFQKMTGRCDMKSFKEFMKKRRRTS